MGKVWKRRWLREKVATESAAPEAPAPAPKKVERVAEAPAPKKVAKAVKAPPAEKAVEPASDPVAAPKKSAAKPAKTVRSKSKSRK